MNYTESVLYIESLMPGSLNPGLERMRAYLAAHSKLAAPAPCFHVGGTNGKGSTTVILESALHHGFGLNVGRFSGPHILSWHERFSVNGKTISQDDFASCATEIKKGQLSWFEMLTAMGLLYFKQKNVDAIVLEVGLGGRYDATNAVSGVVSTIITNIELDHMHILGDTLALIAGEKAGIMKKNVWVTTQAKGAGKAVLVEKAKEAGAPIFCLDQNFSEGIKLVDDWLLQNGNESKTTEQILNCLSLSGEHQQLNALGALISIAKAQGGNMNLARLVKADTGDKLAQALSQVYWPGRLQVVSAGSNYGNMEIILDAAHNPNGAEILNRALSEMKISKRCFILGFFSNKDVPSIMAKLLDLVDADCVVIAYQADSHRQTMAKDEILKLSSTLRPDLATVLVGSISEALHKASQYHQRGYTVVATGSFAVLKDVMKELGWNSVEHARSLN